MYCAEDGKHPPLLSVKCTKLQWKRDCKFSGHVTKIIKRKDHVALGAEFSFSKGGIKWYVTGQKSPEMRCNTRRSTLRMDVGRMHTLL